MLAGEGHIPLACTPDPSSAAPITGAVEPCESKFDFAMSITRIHEDPRVTKPYTDEQWQAIEALGHRIDAEFEAGEVRLTMGGEPTFVSIDDMDGAEWNTAAVGPNKRQLAGESDQAAAQAIRSRRPAALRPGQMVSRRAAAALGARLLLAARRRSRSGQTPILIADERTDYGYGQAEAQTFVAALAAKLGVSPEMAIPAYEDVWYYLWKERRLPVNVDPLDIEARRRGRARAAGADLRAGLGPVVGYALPLQPRADR